MLGETSADYSLFMDYTLNEGMVLVAKSKCQVRGKLKLYKLKFPDIFMDSGWSLTSSVNFLVETGVVMSCLTRDPWKMMKKQDDQYCINANLRQFGNEYHGLMVYESRPYYKRDQFGSRAITLSTVGEGDDVIGQASAWLAEDPRNKDQFMAYARELGFVAKLKLVVDGRGEFCGAHMRFEQGRTILAETWLPDLKRYLFKLGVYAGPNITPASTVARFVALGSAFVGRNEPMTLAFLNSAKRCATNVSRTAVHHFKGFDEVGTWYNKGQSGHENVHDMIANLEQAAKGPYPSPELQYEMALCSVTESNNHEDMPMEEYGNLVHIAQVLRSRGVEATEELRPRVPRPFLL
jgi:hypothetical protein